MKTVFCFGDSNTWGFIPGSDFRRFPYEKRICGILQRELGPQYRILEEALNGRMTAWADPLNPHKNALEQLPWLLDSHRPLDLISIMLGTNDLKHYMGLEAKDCAMGLENLVNVIEAAGCGPGGKIPAILLVAPPHIVPTPTPFGHLFDGAEKKSLEFADMYSQVAKSRNCLFLDAGALTSTPDTDGIHIDASGHEKIARGLAEVIRAANL